VGTPSITGDKERHLRSSRQGFQLEGTDFQPGDIAADPAGILRYTRATKPGLGIMDSCLYARAVSKQSFWLLVEYEVSGASELWVAKASHFLKVAREGKDELRVAVTTLYRKPILQQGGLVFVVSDKQVYDQGRPRAIAMSAIVSTLVSCVIRDPCPQHRRGGNFLRWMDAKEAGKILLIRSANASRFD